MALHVIGRACPSCRSKGLVVGRLRPQTSVILPMAQTFQPEGWHLDRLECLCAVCPKCGLVVSALAPEALKRLQNELRADRLDESVTYHAQKKRPKKKNDPGGKRKR